MNDVDMTEDTKAVVQLQSEWVDKYRPTSLDEYVVDEEIRSYFKNMVSSGNLISFTVAGCQGSGKTTLAKIIAHELNAELLFIKAATEGTVDVLRSKIEPFCNAMSFDGRPKLVIIDEADSATSTTGSGSSFQMGLRTLIEASQSDTRFILTCNMKERILPAVLSRCPIIPLSYSQKDLLIHLKKILDSEKIAHTKDNLKAFIEGAFHFYPDCRKIIKHLQFCCTSGKLVVNSNSVCDSDKSDFISEIVQKALSTESILDVRKHYLQNKDMLIDFVEGASLLFNHAVDNNLISEDGMLKLADLLYQCNVCVDKEPTFFAMVVAMRKYGR